MSDGLTHTGAFLSTAQWIDVIQIGVTIILALLVFWRVWMIESLKDVLTEQRAIREELRGRRGEAHGQIFRLTGALNLYGPERRVALSDLSGDMADWYFEQGGVLREDVKAHYFLIQEVMTLCLLYGIEPVRPAPKALFGNVSGGPVTDKMAYDVLDLLREEILGFGEDGPKSGAELSIRQLRDLVTRWKSHLAGKVKQTDDEAPDLNEQNERAVEAWVLLQYLNSRFRTRLRKHLD